MNYKLIEANLEALKAMINSYYLDMPHRWDVMSIIAVLSGPQKLSIDLASPAIQETFKKWESDGYVKIVGRSDCYLEILKKFPHDSIKRQNP